MNYHHDPFPNVYQDAYIHPNQGSNYAPSAYRHDLLLRWMEAKDELDSVLNDADTTRVAADLLEESGFPVQAALLRKIGQSA
jgi:hypothetical protein